MYPATRKCTHTHTHTNAYTHAHTYRQTRHARARTCARTRTCLHVLSHTMVTPVANKCDMHVHVCVHMYHALLLTFTNKHSQYYTKASSGTHLHVRHDTHAPTHTLTYTRMLLSTALPSNTVSNILPLSPFVSTCTHAHTCITAQTSAHAHTLIFCLSPFFLSQQGQSCRARELRKVSSQ